MASPNYGNREQHRAQVPVVMVSGYSWGLFRSTTFFSVIFATASSLRLQHYIARAISDYLTAETGVTIIFESAIVPKWKDSRISFKNVFISRRPTVPPPPRQIDRDGFPGSGYDISGHPAYHRVGDEEEDEAKPTVDTEIDVNYSMFDLNVDSIDVTLSLWRWLDGRGLIEDAVIKGVRGTLDRRSVYWDPDNPLDPISFRHVARPGDFELDSLQLEDVLITVYQPDGLRPHTASIFQADIKTFRQQWIFYDFLCAENIVGQFDNCLFSLHKPQSIGRTTEMDLKDGDWGRMSRIRIDGVNIDHLQRATTTEGPISWITSGKVDAVLDIKFPRDPADASQLNAILGEIADAISTSLANNPVLERIPAQRELAKPPLQAPEGEKQKRAGAGGDTSTPRVVIDIDLRFRDLKAAVPLFTRDLSYVNYALIRPIVGFMKYAFLLFSANRTLVPIRCRVVKDLADLMGLGPPLLAGLMDEISLQVYDAMAYHITQANMNRRLRTPIFNVAGVSKTWRAAALECSALWSCIRTEKPRHWRVLPLLLERSGSSPLDVHLDLFCNKYGNAPVDSTAEEPAAVVQMLLPHSTAMNMDSDTPLNFTAPHLHTASLDGACPRAWSRFLALVLVELYIAMKWTEFHEAKTLLTPGPGSRAIPRPHSKCKTRTCPCPRSSPCSTSSPPARPCTWSPSATTPGSDTWSAPTRPRSPSPPLLVFEVHGDQDVRLRDAAGRTRRFCVEEEDDPCYDTGCGRPALRRARHGPRFRETCDAGECPPLSIATLGVLVLKMSRFCRAVQRRGRATDAGHGSP
ncbi:mitochondrial distribution and morphology proteins-domain-containing protein [Mycena maculata]|uniref:Mitochondrial distribution and morphology proteins-domain-containing protein n=1 Tax=Mycena maculata TaxID=230809 RepID=A0AAD7MYV2_9AGAR|nr:mitochondrial distribution and morphology proteins-domain-containing protein [Mycena maculata]